MNQAEAFVQTGTVAAVPSLAARWYVLILMCAVYTLSITDRYMVTQVLEPIRLELHLTAGGVGALTGLWLGMFYITMGFPISWLIDRGSRRNIVAASIVGWSVMTMCTGLSRNYWQLLVSRIGIGIGEAGGTPGANSLISDYFPVVRRPMALTVFSLGAPIGAYFASDTTGAIADLHGWRAPFLWLGVPGLLVGTLIYFTVREPRRGNLDAHISEHSPSFMDAMRYLWMQRSAVHVMAASALTALWGWGLMYWTPMFLNQSLRTFGWPGRGDHRQDSPVWRRRGDHIYRLAADATVDARPATYRAVDGLVDWGGERGVAGHLHDAFARRWCVCCSGSSSPRSISISARLSVCCSIWPSRACAPCSAPPPYLRPIFST